MTVIEAGPQHVAGIFHVRVSVRENLLTMAQLTRMGITPESVTEALGQTLKGWVAEHEGTVIGFCLANAETRSIWALFLLPNFEGRGLGTRLLNAATAWLWTQSPTPIWLTTAPKTRAEAFYRQAGWRATGQTATGEIRFELRSPFG